MSTKAYMYGSFVYEGPTIEAIVADCAVQFPWLNLTNPGVVKRENTYHIYGEVQYKDLTKYR